MNQQTLQRPEKGQRRGGSEWSPVPDPQPTSHTHTHSLSLSLLFPSPRRKVVGPSHSPVGVLLRNEEEGVMGGVTGGVRLPLLWRGGVDTFPRDTELDKVSESFGWIFFFRDSCSRRAASVMNLKGQGQVSNCGRLQSRKTYDSYPEFDRCSSLGRGLVLSWSQHSRQVPFFLHDEIIF